MYKTSRAKFLCTDPHPPAPRPNRQTHIWNGAFGNQHCMNIHRDSFFSVSLEASFDVHHYSYFIFPSTGTLLPESVVARYCATHSHAAVLTITDHQCKYCCSFHVITNRQNWYSRACVSLLELLYSHTESPTKLHENINVCERLSTLDGGFVAENQSLSVAWMQSWSWNIKQKNRKLNICETCMVFFKQWSLKLSWSWTAVYSQQPPHQHLDSCDMLLHQLMGHSVL